MPHVTFIHGIANKPSADILLRQWQDHLADGGLDLGASGVSCSMVYWADVVYAEPEASDSNFESVASNLATAEPDGNLSWTESLPPAEKQFSDSLMRKWGLDKPAPDGDDSAEPAVPMGEEDDFDFEAIPLPWFIKQRVLRRFLKDVHHYLFNTSFSPREGEVYETQTYLRQRFIDQLARDKQGLEGRHVVVGHSMGTVISYDCLKNVEGCPEIDGYLTLGSPLGISEIHDNFSPAYNKTTGFPTETVRGDWVNIYDRLDPVAFDARLANDYLLDGAKAIKDERVRNSGAWRHSSEKYFRQQRLCAHLRTLLDL